MHKDVALVSALVSILVSLMAGLFSYLVQKIKLDKEFKLEDSAESAIRNLLNHPNWTQRSFSAISEKIGGFEPDELRKLLVRSGAVRFYRNNSDGEKEELWGLTSKNLKKLNN